MKNHKKQEQSCMSQKKCTKLEQDFPLGETTWNKTD